MKSPVVKTFLAGTVILALSACTPVQVRNLLNVTHPTKDVVTITENQQIVGPVDPPQRLDEVMNNTGDPVQRCDDAGGEPIWYPTFAAFVCEGIDY